MCTCHYLSICPPAGFIQCQLPSLEGIVEAVFCNNQPAEFLGSAVQVFIYRGILGIINCYCSIGSVGKENMWTSSKVGVFVISKLSMIIWRFIPSSLKPVVFFTVCFRKRTSSPPPLLQYLFSCLCYSRLLLLIYSIRAGGGCFFFQKTCQSSVWALMQNPELHCCSPPATCPAEFQSQAVSSVSSW